MKKQKATKTEPCQLMAFMQAIKGYALLPDSQLLPHLNRLGRPVLEQLALKGHGLTYCTTMVRSALRTVQAELRANIHTYSDTRPNCPDCGIPLSPMHGTDEEKPWAGTCGNNHTHAFQYEQETDEYREAINWPCAFNKYGFGDGQDANRTRHVIDFLLNREFQVEHEDSSHNHYITSLVAPDGTKLEADEPGYTDPYSFLPEDLKQALDARFGAGEFYA